MSHRTLHPTVSDTLPDTSSSNESNPSRHRCSMRPEVCGDLGDFFQWKNLIQMEEIVEEDEDDNEDDDDGSLCSWHDDSGICRTGSECSTAGLEWDMERERENCRFTDQSCKASAEYLLTSSSKSSRSDYCGCSMSSGSCSMSSGSNHHGSSDDILAQPTVLINERDGVWSQGKVVSSSIGSVAAENAGPMDDAWSISGLLSETENVDEEEDFDYSQLLDQSLFGDYTGSTRSPQTVRYMEDCIDITCSSQSGVAAPPLPPRNSAPFSAQSAQVLPRAIAAVPRMGTKLSYHDLRMRNHNLRPADISHGQSAADLSPNQFRSLGPAVHLNDISPAMPDACTDFRSKNKSVNLSSVEQPVDSSICTQNSEDKKVSEQNYSFNTFQHLEKSRNDLLSYSAHVSDAKSLRSKKKSRRNHLHANDGCKSCMRISDLRNLQLDDSGFHLDTTSDCEKPIPPLVDEIASPVYEEPWNSSILRINPAKISHSSPAAEITNTRKCQSNIDDGELESKRIGSLPSDGRGKCRAHSRKCNRARRNISQEHTNESVANDKKSKREGKTIISTNPYPDNVKMNLRAISNGVDCFLVYEGDGEYEELGRPGDDRPPKNNNQLLQILPIDSKNEIYSIEKSADNYCDEPRGTRETCDAELNQERHQNEKSLTDVYNRYVEVMYTNKRNLAHTIAIQQQLFQQQLKLSANDSCVNNNGDIGNDVHCENLRSEDSDTPNNSRRNLNNTKSSKCRNLNCVNSRISRSKLTSNQLEGSGKSSGSSACSCSIKSNDNQRVANNNFACENFTDTNNKLDSTADVGRFNLTDYEQRSQKESSQDLVNSIVENPMEWVVKRRKDGSRYITRRPVKFGKKLPQNVSSFTKHKSGNSADRVISDRVNISTDRFNISTDKMSSDEETSPTERQHQLNGQKNLLVKKNLTHKNSVLHGERKNVNDPVLLSVVTV